MTQPGVSQQLKSLENHFGCELVARMGKQFQLADAGQMAPISERMGEASSDMIVTKVQLGVGYRFLPAKLKQDANIHSAIETPAASSFARWILTKSAISARYDDVDRFASSRRT